MNLTLYVLLVKAYCHANPYDQNVKYTLETADIVDIQECKYDKLEISVDGLSVKMMQVTLSFLFFSICAVTSIATPDVDTACFFPT